MLKNIIDVLVERGFIDQITSPDLRDKAFSPMKVYVGFDPTAESLHLGNLVGVVLLSWFQKYGHTPYAIVGGATGRIGDPSGKSTERPMLTDAALSHNVQSLTDFFHRLFSDSDGPSPVVLNNNDWFKSLSVIDFLRDIGKYFRIGPMLGKESVKVRLQSEEGLSFTEFTYQVLQGYDFYYLNQHHGVSLQMGGSDQWGNITAGIELNRKLGGDPIYGLTFPLLTRSDGKKFGKSEEGAIWLSSKLLSPYHFYQHLVRTPDADVIHLLKKLTFLDMEEIRSLEQTLHIPNKAQKKLAEEVTRFVHGQEGLDSALRVTEGMAPGSEAVLSVESLKSISSDVNVISLLETEVVGQTFIELAMLVGLTASKSEGRRLIEQGGAYLNQQKIEDLFFTIHSSHFIGGEYLLLGSGKKKKILLRIEKN